MVVSSGRESNLAGMQAVKHLGQHMQNIMHSQGAQADQLMLDPVAPCASVGPSPFSCPSSHAQQPCDSLSAGAERAAPPAAARSRSWAALAPTMSEDLSAEDWLVVAGGAW